MKRFILPLALFLLLLPFLGKGLQRTSQDLPSPLVGKPVPAFTAPGLYDPAATLSPPALAGQVWLLNVWASWCEPCRAEHASIDALARGTGVAVVGLNYKDRRADAQAWLQAQGNPYRYAVSDPDGRIGIEFGVYGVPETFVIDRHGVIRLRQVGQLTTPENRERIARLVQELNDEQ